MKSREKSAFKAWYEKNKDSLSEQRRRRYQADPEFREAVLARAAQWRRDNPEKVSRVGQAGLKDINGRKLECFRMSEACRRIGCSDQSIRDWEASGLIPEPTVQSAHRYYTAAQIELLRDFFEFMTAVRYDKLNRTRLVAEKSSELRNRWVIAGGGDVSLSEKSSLAISACSGE